MANISKNTTAQPESPSAQKHRRLHILRLIALVTLVLLLATTATFVYIAQRNVIQHSQRTFNEDANRASNLFVSDMGMYTDILMSARSYIQGSQEVTQQEWTGYFRDQGTLQRYPGISSLFYAEIIENSSKPEFLERMRSQPAFGGQPFTIKPAGDRPAYAVSTLIASDNDVRSGYGYDLYSSPERKATLDTAASKNTAAATPVIRFATGPEGFFIVLPVASKDSGRPSGFVGISFRNHDLMQSLYAKVNIQKLRLRISERPDSASGSPAKQLYKSAGWQDEPRGTLSLTNTIYVAERQWQLSFQADQDYENEVSGYWLPITIALAGGLFTLLAAIALVLIRNARHAAARP